MSDNGVTSNGAPSAGELGRRMDRFERDVKDQFDRQNTTLAKLDSKLDSVVVDLATLRTEVKREQTQQAADEAAVSAITDRRRNAILATLGAIAVVVGATVGSLVLHWLGG